MSGRLQGKRAVVLGATSGIGRTVALRYAEEGAKLLLAGRRTELGEDLARELCNKGCEAVFQRTDATVEADVQALCKVGKERFGGLDIALNAQGWNRLDRLTQLTGEVFDQIQKTNLYSMFYAIKYEGELMLEAGKGVIINISSINSTVPNNYQAAYCAAKAGLDMLSKVAALEYGPGGVRVCTINPGLTNTELSGGIFADKRLYGSFCDKTPLRSAAEPEDIANAALFLASDEARFISASSLYVDGGLAPEGYPDVFRIYKGDVW